MINPVDGEYPDINEDMLVQMVQNLIDDGVAPRGIAS